MRYVAQFFRFWYDFIVGDDWSVAAGVVVTLAITALLAHRGVNSWWLMPAGVVVVLAMSLWRVSQQSH
jgi:hypothetical protein